MFAGLAAILDLHAQEIAMDPTVTDTVGAALRTGLAVPTLEKLRCTGGGPRYCKLGRSVRYRISDLDEWVASHVVRDTSDSGR